MSPYIAQLKAAAKADQDRQAKAHEVTRAIEAQAARDRLKPLDDRLARVLSAVPSVVQREGLSLTSVQVLLKGRSRGHAHPGELGTALRRLGWTRRRSWRRGDAGFVALWYPPCGSLDDLT